MIKSLLKRFGKGAAACIVAGMISQVTPLCETLMYHIPPDVLAALNILGIQMTSLCTAGITGILLSAEKAFNWTPGGKQ